MHDLLLYDLFSTVQWWVQYGWVGREWHIPVNSCANARAHASYTCTWAFLKNRPATPVPGCFSKIDQMHYACLIARKGIARSGARRLDSRPNFRFYIGLALEARLGRRPKPYN